MARCKTFQYKDELKVRLWRGKQGLPETVTAAELFQKLSGNWVFIAYGISIKKETDSDDDNVAFEYALNRCFEKLPEALQRVLMEEYNRQEIIKKAWKEIEE